MHPAMPSAACGRCRRVDANGVDFDYLSFGSMVVNGIVNRGVTNVSAAGGSLNESAKKLHQPERRQRQQLRHGEYYIIRFGQYPARNVSDNDGWSGEH